MTDLEREDYTRDAYYDATHSRYDVTITVNFTKRITAKTQDEAENDLYDEIRAALRGSHLDYSVYEFDAEEVDDE